MAVSHSHGSIRSRVTQSKGVRHEIGQPIRTAKAASAAYQPIAIANTPVTGKAPAADKYTAAASGRTPPAKISGKNKSLNEARLSRAHLTCRRQTSPRRRGPRG